MVVGETTRGALRRWQVVCFVAVGVAAMPYLVLKVFWLAGSRVGMGSDSVAAVMHSPRFVVGNVVTIAMELAAIVLALALIRPWGQRVPAWIIVVVGGAATGLLAPILIGIPLGSVLQLFARESFSTGRDDNLAVWVFAIIYGGFGIMAAALAVLFWLYAVGRWGWLLSNPPLPPAHSIVTALCGAAITVFAGAMAYWSVVGPAGGGPAGMATIAQRTVLFVTAVLALAGFLAPLLARRWPRHSALAWAIAWVGCASTALQGPAGIALAHDGEAHQIGIAIAAAATPAALVYGLAVLRRSGPRKVRLSAHQHG